MFKCFSSLLFLTWYIRALGERAGSARSPHGNTAFHFSIYVQCPSLCCDCGVLCMFKLGRKEVVCRRVWLHKHLYQGHDTYRPIRICLHLMRTVHKVWHNGGFCRSVVRDALILGEVVNRGINVGGCGWWADVQSAASVLGTPIFCHQVMLMLAICWNCIK